MSGAQHQWGSWGASLSLQTTHLKPSLTSCFKHGEGLNQFVNYSPSYKVPYLFFLGYSLSLFLQMHVILAQEG